MEYYMSSKVIIRTYDSQSKLVYKISHQPSRIPSFFPGSQSPAGPFPNMAEYVRGQRPGLLAPI